jgi:hypothetical protein
MLSLSPGGALGGKPEEEVKNKKLLYIITHRTPGSHNPYGAVRVLVRSQFQVSARGVAWVSLGRPV